MKGLAVTESPRRDLGQFTNLPQRTHKVCHVSLTLATGGLERILADFARFSPGDQWELNFLAMQDLGRFAEEIRAEGRTVHGLTAKRLPGQVREMVRYFRQHQFDVVHTHNTYPHVYGTLAARLAGIPVVVHTRHGMRFGTGWRSRVKYRLATKYCDRVVAVSRDAAESSTHVDRLPPEKVTCIWNGIDSGTFSYAGSSGEPRGILVGRLCAEKDIATAIKAWSEVIKTHPQAQFDIVGDGPFRGDLEQLIEDLNLKNHVHLLGMQRDVPRHLAKASFYVSSSISEGISLTLLEAMAVGLPVVATTVGGNPEIVLPNETGLLVPPSDPQRLADGIRQVLDSPHDWNRWGRAGRDRVETVFNVHRMISDYEQLYLDLINKKFHRRSRRRGSDAPHD